MKLYQALREVARLHAEDPGHRMFLENIEYAVICVPYVSMNAWLAIPDWVLAADDQPFGDWTARSWMCLILAEYLEESGR